MTLDKYANETVSDVTGESGVSQSMWITFTVDILICTCSIQRKIEQENKMLRITNESDPVDNLRGKMGDKFLSHQYYLLENNFVDNFLRILRNW